MSHRKRQRGGGDVGPLNPDGTLKEYPFDRSGDILLRLELQDLDPCPKSLSLSVYSTALSRCGYFAALLSERWLPFVEGSLGLCRHLTHKVEPPCTRVRIRANPGPFDAHVQVLRLLHTLDFSGEIRSVSDAVEMIPVASELLFEDCIRACVRYIEAVPWTEEEEKGVLKVIPFLKKEESEELLARVSPGAPEDGDGISASEAMLQRLIDSAIRSHPNVATVKVFVAKLLRDYSSRDSVKRALEQAFYTSMETVKDHLGKYASPDFSVAGNNDEREAMQRLNLHSAMMNAKHLHWLVERMIELRVADAAVEEWSEQAALAADLQKTFRDDAWKNIAPGLPSLVIKSTFRLANAVASGTTLAPRQVRMKLVRDWLPVLNVCRDIVSPIGQRSVIHELEESFLSIISTLPMSDAQELLHQCLSFSTRNVDDCPHLISAFETWFRRADRPTNDDSPPCNNNGRLQHI